MVLAPLQEGAGGDVSPVFAWCRSSSCWGASFGRPVVRLFGQAHRDGMSIKTVYRWRRFGSCVGWMLSRQRAEPYNLNDIKDTAFLKGYT